VSGADTVSVERDVAASPDVVWAMIADVTRMAEFSPENAGCEWIGDTHEPVIGARFRGTNRNGKRRWKTVGKVVAADPGRTFAFEVSSGPLKVARWEYRFEPAAGGCRVTETWIDQRGLIVTVMGKPVSGVADRAAHNRAGMEATLERLAAVAEANA
jgi:uncharacterized protein YndB with AHSA1/START domain